MSQQQSATDQINGLLDQLSIEVTAAIGRIAAAWVYLETEFDLALECLLVHRNTEGLYQLPLIRTRAPIGADQWT